MRINKQVKPYLAALAMAVSSTAAQAEPIEFVFSGTADFELGEQFIEGARFSLRATADTESLGKLDHFGLPVFEYANLSGTLFVEGLGEGVFLDPVGLFQSPELETVGFMAAVNFQPFHQVFTPLDILDIRAPVLLTYDMKSDLQLSNTEVFDPQQWYQVGTSLGALTAYGFHDVSLQVTLSPVPEPSTVALWALGGVMVAGVACRRRREASLG